MAEITLDSVDNALAKAAQECLEYMKQELTSRFDKSLKLEESNDILYIDKKGRLVWLRLAYSKKGYVPFNEDELDSWGIISLYHDFYLNLSSLQGGVF